MMRTFTLALALATAGLALAGPVRAQAVAPVATPAAPQPAPSGECLGEREIREEVAARRVVSQLVALRAARAKIGGEAVRARLCRDDAGLVYQITALKRDGKVVRVVVDAASGKVLSPN